MNLTANQKRALRHLWNGELTTEEIAVELGLTVDELLAVAVAMKLPDRSEVDVYLPSRQEILAATALIRSRWTPTEREARRAAAWSVRLEEAAGLPKHDGRDTAHRDSDGGQAARSQRRRRG